VSDEDATGRTAAKEEEGGRWEEKNKIKTKKIHFFCDNLMVGN
jgi:hypothetical protein